MICLLWLSRLNWWIWSPFLVVSFLILVDFIWKQHMLQHFLVGLRELWMECLQSWRLTLPLFIKFPVVDSLPSFRITNSKTQNSLVFWNKHKKTHPTLFLLTSIFCHVHVYCHAWSQFQVSMSFVTTLNKSHINKIHKICWVWYLRMLK